MFVSLVFYGSLPHPAVRGRGGGSSPGRRAEGEADALSALEVEEKVAGQSLEGLVNTGAEK